MKVLSGIIRLGIYHDAEPFDQGVNNRITDFVRNVLLNAGIDH